MELLSLIKIDIKCTERQFKDNFKLVQMALKNDLNVT